MAKLQLDNYQQYLDYLLNNPVETDLFLDKFTINYTYFFRNKDIYEELGDILTGLTKSKKRRITIWSAPCATGEEPYSIAIYLREMKEKSSTFPDFKVIASDIDNKALSIAKKGIYGDYSLHAVAEEIKEKYFEQMENNNFSQYLLSESIKEKVEFVNEDIIEGHSRDTKYDIIFCRNFFIYLNRNARDNFIQILNNHLIDGGLLIIGKTETLSQNSSDFELIDAKTNFYVKKEEYINNIMNLGQQRHHKEKISREEKGIIIKEKLKDRKKKRSLERKKTYKSIGINNDFKSIKRNKKSEEEKRQVEEINQKITEFRESKTKEDEIIAPKNNQIVSDIEDFQESSNQEKKKPSSENEIEFLSPNIAKSKEIDLDFKEEEKWIKEQKEELYLQEQDLEERKRKIKFREKLIEIREKNLKKRIKSLNRKENRLKLKLRQLDELYKPLEKRARELNRREEQLMKREESIKKLIKENKPRENFDLESDLVEFPNFKNELEIQEGHYSIIDIKNSDNESQIFSIEELGSGIVLILRDLEKHLYSISHTPYPDPINLKEINKIEFPHFFIDTSVEVLINEMLEKGAKKENIDAIVIGGAKLRFEKENLSQKNIRKISEELEVFEIPVIYEELGGISRRSIKFEIPKNALHIKKVWEQIFRKINL